MQVYEDTSLRTRLWGRVSEDASSGRVFKPEPANQELGRPLITATLWLFVFSLSSTFSRHLEQEHVSAGQASKRRTLGLQSRGRASRQRLAR